MSDRHFEFLVVKKLDNEDGQRHYSSSCRREAEDMVAIVTPLAGAAAAVLAFASGRNIWQTYSLCRTTHHQTQEYGACASIGSLSGKEEEEVLIKLQSMPRKDLVELFLSSKVPADIESLQGEWNGILLNNNLVLTTVTRFLTNGLFGWGRTWNGKAFYDGQIGLNRFQAKADKSQTETEHQFDFSIAPSRLDSSCSSSITLIYAKHQHRFSLWKTMVDELRVVSLPENSSVQVMICMGSMAWSGGMLNASPFCLWRLKEGKE